MPRHLGNVSSLLCSFQSIPERGAKTESCEELVLSSSLSHHSGQGDPLWLYKVQLCCSDTEGTVSKLVDHLVKNGRLVPPSRGMCSLQVCCPTSSCDPTHESRFQSACAVRDCLDPPHETPTRASRDARGLDGLTRKGAICNESPNVIFMAAKRTSARRSATETNWSHAIISSV